MSCTVRTRVYVVSVCILFGLGTPSDGAVPGRWNVIDFGVAPNTEADCTEAFQNALNAAGEAGGGIVEVPAGRFRIQGTLSIPSGVTLQGTYRVPPTADRRTIEKPDGTVLQAFAGRGKPDGPPFISLTGRNSVVAGMVVDYPEWKPSDVPPVPYPPCIGSENSENVGILDCCLLNPYEAIKLVRAHRHLVRNVTGYPSKRGLYVDECYDIGHIENIHFWPFGVAYAPEDPYCKWINTEGVAFELARTDWHYVSNTFCFGYGIGYKFSQSKSGATNGNFLGLGADSCRRAIYVEQAQPPGLLITNGEFVGRWSSTDSVCIEIDPKCEGKVSLSNCSFWGPIDRCIWMRSKFGLLAANTCHFVHWDNHGAGAPAIQLDAGKTVVQGCTFSQDGTNVQVAAEVRSAILMGNQAEGGFHVINEAESRTQMLANEVDPLDALPEALAHYRVDIGGLGDGRFGREFFGRESRGYEGVRNMARWTTDKSYLQLPVIVGKTYTLTLEVMVPPAAECPEAGLYLGDQRLVALDRKSETVTVELPPSTSGRQRVEIRCQGWVPKATIKDSNDDRKLGITVYAATMKAEDSTPRVFDVNAGDWVKP